MGRGACAFKEADVRRAIKAVKAAGELVRGIRFTSEGGFVVLTGTGGGEDANTAGARNPWDEVLDHGKT